MMPIPRKSDIGSSPLVHSSTALYLCLTALLFNPFQSSAQAAGFNNGQGGNHWGYFEGAHQFDPSSFSGERPYFFRTFLLNRIDANSGMIPEDALPQVAPMSVMRLSTDLTPIDISSIAMPLSQSLSSNTKFVMDSRNAKGVYYLAGGACQPFFLQSNDDTSCVVGSPGTVLAPGGGRNVILKEGKILVAVGKKAISIKTISAHIQVAPGAVAVVEQSVSGVIRAATLVGPESSVMLTVADNNFTVYSGEELLIADKALNNLELVSSDGIERQLVEGAITVAGLQVQKCKFNPKAMAQHQNKLLVCNAGSFSISHQAFKALSTEANKKYLGNHSAGTQKSSSLPENANIQHQTPSSQLKLISQSQPQLTTNERTLGTSTAIIKDLQVAEISLDNGEVITLKSGEILLHALRATTLKTINSTIQIKPGTTALVTANDKSLKICNLCDQQANSIYQVVGDSCINIPLGQETIIAPDSKELYASIQGNPVGRRHLIYRELANGLKMASSEVSLVSLFRNSSVLQKLRQSRQPIDQSLSGQLLKTAVAVDIATSSHGQYVCLTPDK